MSSPTETSPDPGNALKVAIMFVKQYYKCLSSHPDMLERFYSPGTDSYLSHGEGSEPTAPSPLSASNHGHDRWGCAESEKMMFEFEDGAIDAQPSQNDGILMVVTASVIFNGSGSVKTERRKTFVQTFFLAKLGRNFAVTNDILRFLTLVAESETPEEEAVYVDANTGTDDELEVPEKTETAESTALVADEKKTDPMEDKAAAVTEDESSAPGGGVEETKEEAPEEDLTGSDSKKRSSSKDNKSKKNKGAKQHQQPPPASKPAPGSWASLVVSGGSAPNTPSRAPEKKSPNNNIKPSTKQPPLPPSDDAKDNGETEKKSEKDKSTTPANGKANAKTDKANNNNNNNNKQSKDNERTKRDPDNTLVIKNLSENIKEQDILSMFQPFATATKAKIVGTNLNHHRLLAFVDYDSVAPVMAALKKHKETPFEWNGKVLEVDQKTLEQRARRKAGGNQNSNNQNNQNNNNQSNGFRNAGAGRGGGNNNKYNNNNSQNGRGDGGGRRRGTRAGR
mmetsp:Transcript_9257/g.22998  ORF Transcript_9257/g.22998 Transcript_9257/m.22998 type:complete len:508 (-) Transcript_9257:189-1712(-)